MYCKFILIKLQKMEGNPIVIFCSQNSNRLNYILTELLERRLGIGFQTTRNKEEFLQYKGPKINYSEENLEGSLQIIPVKLLMHDSIEIIPIEVKDEKWWIKTFFPSDGDIPFDVFAASFYLLSRYEEYLPTAPDKHGRYSPFESCAYKNNFLHLPLVDIWALQIKWHLEEKFGPLPLTLPSFEFLSTIDIDFAYRYRGIGFRRYWLKLANALVHLRLRGVAEQIQVGINYKNDPYDTYAWISKVCSENQIELRYFVLLCSGTLYDKNIPPYNEVMRNLILKLFRKYPVGLHPSYHTSENIDLLLHEKAILESYTHQTITHTRQHYLRYMLPDTFMELLEGEITDDYSVGYSAISGFRASTAHPFNFFNLLKNKTCTLLLHPVAIMDVNFKNNPETTPTMASAEIEKLMNQVKKVNGTFISIWHNSNLSHHEGWYEWREVFRKMHTLASSKQKQAID